MYRTTLTLTHHITATLDVFGYDLRYSAPVIMSFSVLLLAQRLRRSVNGERANVSRRPFGTETVSSRVRRGTERSAYAYKRSDTKRITDGAVVDPRAFRIGWG